MERNTFKLTNNEIEHKSNKLIGFTDIRLELKNIAELCFNHSEQTQRLEFLDISGNVLLFGSPGTGKTSLCYDCMRNFKDATKYNLNFSSLISEKLGKTPNLINNFFEELCTEAKQYPTFLLIEELEAFLPNRETSKDLEDMKRALTVFMHYLDMNIPNLMILCTTNYKKMLDPAIMRRFSFSYEIASPSREQFHKFFTSESNPFNKNFDCEDKRNALIEELISKKITFSDVKHLMRKIYLSNKDTNNQITLEQLKHEVINFGGNL